eukprot:10411727-Karenia_brevis.AAC.1
MPALQIQATPCFHGFCINSPGYWTDSGHWCSAQAYHLPRDAFGLPARTSFPRLKQDPLEQSVRRHVQEMIQCIRLQHQRDFKSEVFWRVLQMSASNEFSKLRPLAARLRSPGQPLHCMMSNIRLPKYRSAWAAFFAGDFFLGRYAGNFYAKSLLPRITSRCVTEKNQQMSEHFDRT